MNPAATVQAGQTSVDTSLVDGSFVISAPMNSTSVIVNTGTLYGTTTFTFPALLGTTDIGDLWVGPVQVVVSGQALDSSTGNPIANATVSYAGRNATTNASGNFSLIGIAYSNTTQAAFWGIVGTIRATGFYAQSFTTSGYTASSGIVSLPGIYLTPTNDPDPPPSPYTIHGRVLPTPGSAGTVVTLWSGSTPIRVFNVDTDGGYSFWVGPGSYTITYQNGTLTAPTQNVTVDSQTDVELVPDVTLG